MSMHNKINQIKVSCETWKQSKKAKSQSINELHQSHDFNITTNKMLMSGGITD